MYAGSGQCTSRPFYRLTSFGSGFSGAPVSVSGDFNPNKILIVSSPSRCRMLRLVRKAGALPMSIRRYLFVFSFVRPRGETI